MAREQKTPEEEGKLENAEIKNGAKKDEIRETTEHEPELEHEADSNVVKYVGKAASYTIGTVRFEPGQSREIDPAYMDTAMRSGQFEEV